MRLVDRYSILGDEICVRRGIISEKKRKRERPQNTIKYELFRVQKNLNKLRGKTHVYIIVMIYKT